MVGYVGMMSEFRDEATSSIYFLMKKGGKLCLFCI